MKVRLILIPLLLLGAILIPLLLTGEASTEKVEQAINAFPSIYPDYNGVTIPPNIAPLNFIIQEEGEAYRAVVKTGQSDVIKLENRDGCMQFPMRAWKQLLADNRGGEYTIEIAVKKEGTWHTFKPITNQIANEDIDSFLVYRLLNSAYTRWSEMGIYQRDVESFDERPIINNHATEGKCMNCHSFNKNDPQTMMLHLRGGSSSGTLILLNDEVRKVNTATDFNRAGAYPAWHPSSKMIAFSVNKLEMFFHGTAQEPRDVLDRGSDIILYFIENNLVTTSPLVASVDRMETFPAWSPDGTWLYFCSCPDFASFIDGDDFRYEDILYDLYRIPYNLQTREWGELELVLAGADVGKSITMPRISPGGTYLMCCLANDGHFPIYKPSSELYLLNLETRDLRKLNINSDQADTYHSWSSNGRWFVFSSKRLDGLMARPFFAYFEADGTSHKPFILPQKDPRFYQSFLKTYNRPELVAGPVTVRPQVFVKTAYDNSRRFDATLDPKVAVRDQPVGGEKMYNIAPN
ncbi:PD40 domain-containing protein [candidate division KSB1 bacterium]|nr:PD40 domain-containing protein [candidate division KSB1 bacterium]